jgi:hypothetical protein
MFDPCFLSRPNHPHALKVGAFKRRRDDATKFINLKNATVRMVYQNSRVPGFITLRRCVVAEQTILLLMQKQSIDMQI